MSLESRSARTGTARCRMAWALPLIALCLLMPTQQARASEATASVLVLYSNRVDLLANSAVDRGNGPPVTGVYGKIDLKGTLDLMLRLQPDLSEVFLVAGGAAEDRGLEARAGGELRVDESRVKRTYLVGRTLAELRARLSRSHNARRWISPRICACSRTSSIPVCSIPLGLVGAVQSRCTEVEVESGLRVAVRASDDADDAPPEVALCVYRVAQEALRNTAAHARARNASVVLDRQDGYLKLTVADDGAGFAAADSRERPALGLMSLEERVRMLGGTFAVKTAQGAGTTVTAHIPIGAQHATARPAR